MTTNGIVEVAAANALARPSEFTITTSITARDLGSQGGEPFGAPFGGVPLNNKIASFDIAQVAQSLVDPSNPVRPSALGELVGWDPEMHESKAMDRLLRPDGAR
jgi:hypothetical protein